jgi:hypothetical protein
MSVFALGRMRHLDLLAMWHQRNPDSHESGAHLAAGMSKDRLAATLAP